MARPSLDLVLSQWYKPFENFQASPKAFYSAVEDALRRREIPDAKTSRIDWKEGGLHTAKREYLRVKRWQLVFDIRCAPPVNESRPPVSQGPDSHGGSCGCWNS